MSVASEISRLRTAKADLKTSIEAKGVTVPSSAKLDNYANYVDAISVGATLQAKTNITPTESSQTITADNGYDGLSSVQINAISSSYVGSGITSRSSSDLTASGATVTAPAGYYSSDATKTIPNAVLDSPTWSTSKDSTYYKTSYSAPISTAGYLNHGLSGTFSILLEDKSVTPSETQQTITPTNNSHYLNNVTVDAIPSNYVGSGITQRTSSDLTASGATVTAPAGYYSSDATKTIASGSATPAASISGSSATVEANGIQNTVIFTKTISNTPQVTAGYISSGTSGNTEVSLSADIPIRTSVTGLNGVDEYVVIANNGYYPATTSHSIPHGATGTPTATKGTVSNHSVSVTPSVTNTTGYITGSTINGTAVTVSASELVSGTLTVTASGTTDVTNYESISVPAISLPNNSTPNQPQTTKVATITPSINTTYLNIPTGFNATARHYEIEAVDVDTKTITENGTYYAYMDGHTGYSSVTVNVSGGGSGGTPTTVDQIAEQSSSTGSTITFSNLLGTPTSFIIISDEDITTSSTATVASLVFDGSDLHAQTITNTSNAQVSYDGSSFSYTYSNGTLVVTSTGPSFGTTRPYAIVYTYGGSSSDVNTANVQVGSGATSITFTGLEEEPVWWSCIFKSNFSTSNGYQRVIYVTEGENGNIFGMAMDSSAHIASNWTKSYNNGSFTLTSSGTNAGGYFHQPGYYQLTYVIASDGEGGSYQRKTVTPTTSQQIITADSGYEALSQVTVNAIPSSYVQPTTTVGSTTYRASTSAQTINAGTYHSAAATIAAVTQTNLTADNIKSGTTITISNGQSNLWSVTGTYTGGGSGGSFSVATTTWNNSTNTTTSHEFTGLSGTPKFAVLRCTSQLTRSSSNTYYYIADIVWNGTSAYGNYHLRSNGSFNNVASNATTKFTVTTGTNSITFTSGGTRGGAPGAFYNGTYELTYVY